MKRSCRISTILKTHILNPKEIKKETPSNIPFEDKNSDYLSKLYFVNLSLIDESVRENNSSNSQFDEIKQIVFDALNSAQKKQSKSK